MSNLRRQVLLAKKHRPVLVDLKGLDEFVLRTYEGRRLRIDWGEPRDGVYEPAFTEVDDGNVVVLRVVLDELELRAGGK